MLLLSRTVVRRVLKIAMAVKQEVVKVIAVKPYEAKFHRLLLAQSWCCCHDNVTILQFLE